MFVENKQPNSRMVGRYLFHGGLTKVDEDFYKNLKKDHMDKSFGELEELGVLEVIGAEKKVTKAMVEKTFDLNILEEWAADKKLSGVIKGAVKKQIEVLTAPEDK